jgi:HPr kinase
MMTETYRIAENNITICSQYEDVHRLCHGYETSGKPDFTVTISVQDIEYESQRSALQDKKERLPVRKYYDGYLETLAIYRKIAEKLIDSNIILFHGSVVSVDGEGYLFTAKSGTGKSTHTRLWREYFGERAVMVNDDKPLLKISDNCVTVYGTSWNGKHRLGENISVPLKAVCILTRDKENHIESAEKHDVYPVIVQQAYRPENREKIIKLLSLIDKLINNISLYVLGCNMDISAAETAYNAMKG